jgi:hypothetical protein
MRSAVLGTAKYSSLLALTTLMSLASSGDDVGDFVLAFLECL